MWVLAYPLAAVFVDGRASPGDGARKTVGDEGLYGTRCVVGVGDWRGWCASVGTCVMLTSRDYLPWLEYGVLAQCGPHTESGVLAGARQASIRAHLVTSCRR